MPEDEFRTVVNGMTYSNLDGKGGPDPVQVCNSAPSLDRYVGRTYRPVNVKALLELAEELEWRYEAAASPGELGYVNAGEMAECASRIRDALGMEDA